MPRPLLSLGGIICSYLLLFAPSSSSLWSTSPSSPSLVAASAAGALQPERDDATATTAAAFSSPSSSSTARRLGGGRVPAYLGGSSRFSIIRLGRRGEDNDDGDRDSDRRRRCSFSVVDSATTAPTTAAATPTSLLSRPSRPRRRSRHSSLPPTIDVYVRTYSGDAAWLTWLLRSMEENVEEGAFRRLVLSVPRGDAPLFESLLPSFRLRIVLLVVDDARFERATKAMKSPTENGGYHAQMFDKLTRPPLFSDADYFVHVDSDCVFKRQPLARRTAKEAEGGDKKLPYGTRNYRKVSRRDFVDDRGRVRVRRVAFASLPEPFRRWQRAAEGMLLEPVPYETMSCFPLVFPREVYGLVRELVLERHGGGGNVSSPGRGEGEEGEGGGEGPSSAPPLLRVLSQRLDDFGEFTAMGHVLTTRMEEGERWVPDADGGGGRGGGGEGDGDGGEQLLRGERREEGGVPTPTSASPESFCALAQQAWSWGSVTPEAAAEAERSLRVGW